MIAFVVLFLLLAGLVLFIIGRRPAPVFYAAWGVFFVGVSVFRALASGANPIEHIGPIGVLGVIGFTVGGLVGPMARGIASRSRGP